MKNSIFKSIGAILAGFAAVVVLSNGTDIILESIGFLKLPFLDNPWWLILLVAIYRSIYTITGCYIAASLAPNCPMFHALTLGGIGFVIGILSSFAMSKDLPVWFSVLMVALALPCAWLGGKLKNGG
jgi:hypothetical protein